MTNKMMSITEELILTNIINKRLQHRIDEIEVELVKINDENAKLLQFVERHFREVKAIDCNKPGCKLCGFNNELRAILEERK